MSLRFDSDAIKDSGKDDVENHMDMERLLTEEKTDAIWEKIQKGLEENKIIGSTQIIKYAMEQAWVAGFEEGRNYPLK